MKLKLPQVYSQRDSRWSSILLGYNTDSQYNIGSYGCTITCLSMYVNKTPDQTNQTLKDNSGFLAGGGLLVWGKVPCLGITQTYVSPSYNGPVTDAGIQKAQSLLDQGYPLLCEIDFNPATIGEEMHFVLAIGYDGENFTIADPWVGAERNMDVYGGFRRAVIQFRAYDRQLPFDTGVEFPDLQGQLDQCRVDRDTHWNQILAISQALNTSTSQDIMIAEIKKLVTLEDAVAQKEKELAASQAQVTSIQKEASDLKSQIQIISNANTEAQNTIRALKSQIADQETTLTNQSTQIANLSQKIQELEATVPIEQYNGLSLIVIGIKKLFGR